MMANDYVRGVIKGLEMSTRLAEKLQREDSQSRARSVGRYDRNTAEAFWRAINACYYLLVHGDRKTAIRRLEGCIQKFRVEETNAKPA